jgi:hypothetical protein
VAISVQRRVSTLDRVAGVSATFDIARSR